MPMAQDVLFPMPLGDYPGVHPDKMPWLHAILLGLNSFLWSWLDLQRRADCAAKTSGCFSAGLFRSDVGLDGGYSGLFFW